MAYSPMVPYIPVTDFSDDEATQQGGRSTVDTSGLDAELAALQTLTDSIKNNMELMQRSDGFIQDKFIHPFNLSDDLLILMTADWNPRGDWVTATPYKLKDVVKESGVTYMCQVAHTSGVFVDDVAAGKWIDFGELSAAEVKIAYESNPNTNEFDDQEKLDLAEAVLESDYANTSIRIKTSGGTMANAQIVDARIVGRSGAEIQGLDATAVRSMINVEDGATADQTNTEIRDAVEAATNSNTFNDADHSKLGLIEDNADVTDATNVGAVATLDSDYSNNSIRFKNSVGTMSNLNLAAQEVPIRGVGEITKIAIGTQTILGRLAGNIQTITAAEERTRINVADGAEVNPALIPQAEVEAGVATTERVISAERFKQGVDALGTTQDFAIAMAVAL